MPTQCMELQTDCFSLQGHSSSTLPSSQHGHCGDSTLLSESPLLNKSCLEMTSLHEQGEAARHKAIFGIPSIDMDLSVLFGPEDVSSKGNRENQGTDPGSVQSVGSLPKMHSASIRPFASDHIPEPIQVEKPEELGDQGITLQEDVEMSNDSMSNEVTESEENGKELSEKSCSDVRSPQCSSNAFSLMMADTEHNPSTSGYSSEQPDKEKTQKDLLKTLKELRSHLPHDKRIRGKSSTAAALKYALHCIQQVQANEEYSQMLMVNGELPCRLEVSCYSVQEIENITSEYTRNNTDMFAVAVSLVTGRIIYISEQASVVLRCGPDMFSQIRFVELIAPQDVNVFYSSTSPYKLPSWNICCGADSSYVDCMEEKSFYCRIRCGRVSRKEILYHPFRMTPYLIWVKTEETAKEQLCCVLFAERVHSGYEAPRIPADKRIFTTTHTPSCLFQDIDERAVPLLGYLPQDLIGSSILLHIHPKDRPLMLAVHKKILQNGGQPFDFSPIRFCARNGEYITIDTSWSSFINPWSRKVSFIIGRHKVRTGPVNEDVFAAPPHTEDKSLHPGIQEITEQIYHLLMQPVHNSSSSGYGSLGSNGSHENPMSAASSSDSNGNSNEDIKDKHVACQDLMREHGRAIKENKEKQKLTKNLLIDHSPGTRDFIKEVITDGPGSGPCPVQSEDLPTKQHPYSYQQISCLDSVIRYLESCGVPTKSKWDSSGCREMASSHSDHNPLQHQKTELEKSFLSGEAKLNQGNLVVSETLPKLPSCTTCPSLKLMSQASSSGPCISLVTGVPDSTISSLQATQPLSAQGSLPCTPLTSISVAPCPALTPLSLGAKAESVVSFTSHCSYSSTIVHVGDKKLQPETEMEDGPSAPGDPAPISASVAEPYRQMGLTKEVLAAHTQKEENDFLTGFMDIKKLRAFQDRCNSYLHERPGAPHTRRAQGAYTSWKRTGKTRKPKTKRVRPESWDSSSSGAQQAPRCPLPGLNTTAWSQSDASHTSYPPLPYPVLPAYPLPVFPSPQIPVPNETAQIPSANASTSQPFPAPLLPPMVALVLPNYVYPASLPTSLYPGPAPQPAFPAQQTSYLPQSTFPASQPTFPAPAPAFSVPQPNFTVAQPVFPTPQNAMSVLQPLYTPQPVQIPFPAQPMSFPIPATTLKMKEGISRSSTPQEPPSPPLFQSRCSSPLQLNLLQLEETQKVDHTEGNTGSTDKGGGSSSVLVKLSEDSELHLCRAAPPADAQNSDAMSICSDLMDFLREDTSSGTCSASSAISDSMTSGSHGNGASGSQTGSSLTSRSSKYFGSVDSSENKAHGGQKTESPSSKSIMKYVLQDPVWLLMANADENVMMSYQIPKRDIEVVLKEDRERLKSLQKIQPHFTEDQKKELGETHTWMHRGGLPRVTEVTDCVYCRGRGSEYGEAVQALELSEIMESCD
ncbi:period circadian regulator 2 L homeolog [Xenopus laevis]|uniref:Period circadian protein homolog 2 n=1 Tax=Xenopus laevis TaxID=8355 RepID=Q9DG29_XENLA|nr:period circadian regulator 2 L homeolog [Xenopus laevis]AAG01391.1 period 2 [Xenopus laevis]